MRLLLWGALAVVPLAACGGTYESDMRTALDAVEPSTSSEEVTAPTDGRLATYVAHAARHSPELRASFERWRSATHAISARRRLPEPMISYGFYIRRVETRVGPQRHRVSLSQVFPWPTKLTRGADAASARARAAQRRFDADAIALRYRVEDAYWRLWEIHEVHRLTSEHDVVLETLAETARGRLAVGDATLADVNQIELTIARHHDHRDQHHERAQSVTAELAALLSTSFEGLAPVEESPPAPALPDIAALRATLDGHPRVQEHTLLAEAAEADADSHAADRLPRARLAVDYIETGPAAVDGVEGSGDDALVASIGLSLPLWQGTYSEAESASEAEARAHSLDRVATRDRMEAELARAVAVLRNTHRRVRLFTDTLVPQAETAFESVLGAYQSGRSTPAALLLAQRDLLELQLELARARAAHARGWAEIRRVTATELP